MQHISRSYKIMKRPKEKEGFKMLFKDVHKFSLSDFAGGCSRLKEYDIISLDLNLARRSCSEDLRLLPVVRGHNNSFSYIRL